MYLTQVSEEERELLNKVKALLLPHSFNKRVNDAYVVRSALEKYLEVSEIGSKTRPS